MGSVFEGVDNGGNCPKCNIDHSKRPKIWTLYIKIQGKTIKIKASPECEVYEVKERIYDKHNIDPKAQQLIFEGKELIDGDTLAECGVHDRDTLHVMTETRGIKSTQMHYNHRTGNIVIGREHGIFGKTIEIPCYHVSCKSDPIKGQNMVGVVLYSYNNQTDWRLNNIHCKSGYVILKSSDKIANIDSETWHGKCYKSVFGRDIDNKVVGGGFSFCGNEWKFRSSTFNRDKSEYHDNCRKMNKLEQTCIEFAIENWKKKIQNTKCLDIRNRYKGYCRIHYFYN
eukprot:471773_1